ncbi:MAG: hypothetical protein WCC81_24290 [Pseudolabrys sp.]
MPPGSNSHRIFIARDLRGRSPQNIPEKEATMLDVILLALGLGFFVLSIGYAYACDRL